MTQYYWTEPGKAPVPCYVVGLATTVPESLITIRVPDPFDPGQVQKEVPAAQVFKLEPFVETPKTGCGGNCGGCSCSSGVGILKM